MSNGIYLLIASTFRSHDAYNIPVIEIVESISLGICKYQTMILEDS